MTQPHLLTPEAAADFLQVSAKTLKTWRTNGTGPAFSRIGHRTVRYAQEDLNAWLASVATRRAA